MEIYYVTTKSFHYEMICINILHKIHIKMLTTVKIPQQ